MTEVNLTRTHSIDMVLGARMRYEQLETGGMSRPAAAPAAVVTVPVSPVPHGLNVLLESQQARKDLVSIERLPVAGTDQRHPLHSVSRRRKRLIYSTKRIREQRKRRKNAAPRDDKYISRQELKSRVLGFIADHKELDWDTAGPDEVGGPWKQLAKFIHGPRAKRDRAKYFCSNYRRKSDNWLLRKDSEPLKGRRASLVNSKVGDDDDASSLNEYGDIDAGKFTEEGSFIGDYGTERSRRGAGRTNDSAVA